MKLSLMCLCFSLISISQANSACCGVAQVQNESPGLTLSPDELVFVSKLADQNRKIFAEKLNSDQRKAVMIAFQNGALPDEAVHRMLAAQELKAKVLIVQAEDTDNSDG